MKVVSLIDNNISEVEVVTTSGGFANNVFFTNIDSDIIGYKKLSNIADTAVTDLSVTVIDTDGQKIARSYLFDLPIGVDTHDAGIWSIFYNAYVDSAVGDTRLIFEPFMRASNGNETTLFTEISPEINNTTTQRIEPPPINQPQFTVDANSRFGVRIKVSTTSNIQKTVHTSIGGENASYFNSPIAPRHTQLRGLNDDTNYQHITTAQVSELHTHTNKTALDVVTNTGDGSQYLANDGTYKTVTGGGLTNWTESNYLYSTKYGVKFTPNSAQTNVDVVFQPKGTGAVLAQQPDGTATGGNNRGDYAVDLQAKRTSNLQIANGMYSVIGGGLNNRASSICSVVSGGQDNASSGQYSAICGGSNNKANVNYSSVLGGANHIASGDNSAVLSGSLCTSSSMCSLAFGRGVITNKYGQFSHSSGYITSQGDAQTSELTMLRQTTDATPTELFLDGSSARLTLVNNSTLFCSIMIVGKKSGATAYTFERRVRISKDTTAGSTVLLGSVETIGTDFKTDAGADVAITADTTNGSLKIMVTGIAGTTINWIALVKNIEIVKA